MAQITLNSTGVASNASLVLQSNGTTSAVTVDTSQNVGVGVTPSAWTNNKGLEVGSVGNGFWGFNSTEFNMFQNSYYGSGFKYAGTGLASRYEQNTGKHAWYTAPTGTAGNAITFTQAMTLDASGNLLVGTTSALQSSKLSVLGTGNIADFRTSSASGYPIVCENIATGSTSMIVFLSGPSTTTVGSITYNSTTGLTVYATTSDYRLKTVVGAVTGHGERIDALEPVEYTWKSNGLRTRGFLAHKFQEIYEGSVTGTKDAVDADGKPVYQGMQAGTSEVIADLVAEIQSLRQRLAALEAA